MSRQAAVTAANYSEPALRISDSLPSTSMAVRLQDDKHCGGAPDFPYLSNLYRRQRGARFRRILEALSPLGMSYRLTTDRTNIASCLNVTAAPTTLPDTSRKPSDSSGFAVDLLYVGPPQSPSFTTSPSHLLRP